MPNENKLASTLQTREQWGRNLITLLLIGAAGLTGLYFWGQIVPWLLDVATNTLKLVGVSLGLAAVLYVVLDPNIRNLVLYGYRSFTRMLINWFIDIDPIGILNTYVSRLKERLAEMDKAIGSLRGQREQLAELIAKNENERIHNLQRAKHAKEIVDKGGENASQFRGEIALSGRQAGRLGKSNETLSNLLKRIDVLLKALGKMRETSDVLVQDIQSEVKVRTEEHKAITKGFGAFNKARRMMATDGAEKEIYDMTLEKLADDYADKMGQIENFMDISKSIINGVDLDNMSYEEDALAQLEAWEKKDTGALAVAPGTADVAKVRVETTPQDDGFSDLFDNSKGQQNKAP